MILCKLKEPLKIIGKLDLYNGLNITQGRYFLKVSCKLHLIKLLQSHDCMELSKKTTLTPMIYNMKYVNDIHDKVGPEILED